jgi:hypothetical protein
MNAWLGVVSAEHVRRGVSLGIAQIGHGKRAGLARMHEGDTLVYYSPVDRLGDAAPLRQFTAIGTVTDGEDGFTPLRRVRYENTRPVYLDQIKGQLQLTTASSWGYQLRRGPGRTGPRRRSCASRSDAVGWS